MGRREDRADGRRLDAMEQQWRDSFKHPGDYWAGEPPTVDDPAIGYQPDSAPYPHDWPSDKRIQMTWWAQREHIKVDYEPNAADEGASGWEAAWASMERRTGMARVQIDSAKAAAANPLGQLPEAPAYVDPGEPRHPQNDDIGGW